MKYLILIVLMASMVFGSGVAYGPETTSSNVISSVTMGERNALNKAERYLSIMAFSRTGLLEQLEYDGYSNSEALYAVNNCGADWNEQAAQKAARYLDIMSFSRSGLIEQLEYDGFTHSQAVYGVGAVGY